MYRQRNKIALFFGRYLFSVSLAFIICSLLVFLFIPTEFFRIEDSEIHSSTSILPEYAKTKINYDKNRIAHTRWFLPNNSSSIFSLELPYLPLTQNYLRFRATPSAENKSAVLKVEALILDKDESAVLVEPTQLGMQESFSVLLSLPTSKCKIKIISILGDIQIDDIRITPRPWPLFILGVVLMAISVPLRVKSEPGDSSRRYLFIFIFIAMMLISIAVGLEVFFRLVPSKRPKRVRLRLRDYPLQTGNFDFSRYVYDEELGFRILPHLNYNYTYKEGDLYQLKMTSLRIKERKKIHLQYDSNGFRNKSEPRTRDVVFLGDSILEGCSVNKTLCDYFSELSRLSCANLGVSCQGTTQQRRILERYGFSYDPKFVILIFFEGNDLYDNYLFEKIIQEGPHSTFTYYGSAVFKARAIAFRNAPLDKFLISKMIPWSWSLHFWPRYVIPDAETNTTKDIIFYPKDNCANYGRENRAELPKIRGGLQIAFHPHHVRCLAEDPDEGILSEGWNIAKRELRRIQEECTKRGVEFLICFMPSKAHIYIPHVQRAHAEDCFKRYLSQLVPTYEENFLEKVSKNIHAQRKLLSEFCEQNNICFVDLYPSLADKAGVSPLRYYANDIHLNPTGHKIVAKELHRWINDNVKEYAIATQKAQK